MAVRRQWHGYLPEVLLGMNILLMVLFTFIPSAAGDYVLVPRSWYGILGIFTSPYLHAGLGHLLSNLMLFFPCAAVLLILYKRAIPFVLIGVHVISGAIAWLFGIDGIHIGYSGVAIGIFFFLVVAGIFSFERPKIVVGIVLGLWQAILFQSIWVIQPDVSYDTHIAGAITGSVLAWILERPLAHRF